MAEFFNPHQKMCQGKNWSIFTIYIPRTSTRPILLSKFVHMYGLSIQIGKRLWTRIWLQKFKIVVYLKISILRALLTGPILIWQMKVKPRSVFKFIWNQKECVRYSFRNNFIPLYSPESGASVGWLLCLMFRHCHSFIDYLV